MFSARPSEADRQLQDIVTRLIQTIEEENSTVAKQGSRSLDNIIHKKSQLLLELMRFQKAVAVSPHLPGNQKLLLQLKSALAKNQHLLGIHLAAARDITDTILEAMRQGDSDGTYGGGTNAYYGKP